MAGNQYQPDPRQSLFLKYYLDPEEETFSNAYQSALKAGYEDEYAKRILSSDLDWLSENIKYEHLIKKAEKNLEEFLSDLNEDIKVKSDITKFVLSRLKKDKFSERQELTGKDGKDLPTPILKVETDVSRDNSDQKD